MDIGTRQPGEHTPTKRNVWLSGISIAPGLAVGKAFVYHDILEQDLHAHEIRPDEVDTECERVHRATERVLSDLDESARQVTLQIGPYQAEIFHAHRLMLRELVQSCEIRQEMGREHVNAETAVHHVFQRWSSKMHEAESAGFLQRAEDVADLGRRLVRALMGISVHPLEAMPEGSVLVAPCLLPSDAVFFASRKTAAIVVESGAPGSHCALLIRQIGIPGVASIPDVTAAVSTGDVARDVRIMVPMVTVPEDMRMIREAVESQASELGIAKIPPLIAMIETPAAALCVPEILRFADAISLGTNDLTQYTMAAGRQNPLVHRYFQDDHPAVLRLIRLAAAEAGDALVAVCGELAGRPDAVPTLLKAGVRLLSVAPPLVPMIKESVRNSIIQPRDG